MIPFLAASESASVATVTVATDAVAATATNPMVTFLVILGVTSLVSFASEYIVQRFGRSPIINWRMIITIGTTAAAYLFWTFWSQQVDFASAALDPANSAFRGSLWLFLAVTIIVPLWMCYSALLSVWYDRWFPGITLLGIRILVCIVMVGGYVGLLRKMFSLLSDVRLGLFD